MPSSPVEGDRTDATSPTVWIINPYGTLPSESWATYRSTMLADCLVQHGYTVTQFISNFEHRSKTFRTAGREVLTSGVRYTIQVIPSIRYDSHISLRRVRYERTFARNVLKSVANEPPPDFIILAEPSLFYYDILLRPLLSNRRSILVLDVIDIWPEIFEMVIPRRLRALSNVLLAPLYYWRKRLYRYPAAIVAVAEDYLRVARRIAPRTGVVFDVVYWSYDGRDGAAAHAASPAVERLVKGKKTGEVWVVYAGTLGENYDIPALIAVARRIPDAFRDRVPVKFIVAGDGPLKRLCEESVTENFVFLGRLAAAELALLYQHCDIALSTYKGESTVAMPIKAFDYLRYGLPIVNSLGRDLGELVRHHGLGINYDPRSASSLFEAVHRLVGDAAMRHRCSVNARRLSQDFSAERQYAKFVDVLRRVAHALPSTQ